MSESRKASVDRRTPIVGEDALLTLPEDEKVWYKVPHLIHLNLIILSLFMVSGTLGYDGSLMNGLQSLPQWQTFMQHPTGAWLGFINAIQAVGAIITYPAQAYCADRFGRKFCLYFGYAFIALGVALQTAATNIAMFIIARFFIGVASGWFPASAILITEIAYPSHRAKATALYNCQFYVGSLISAWVTFGVRNMNSSWAWRVPSLLQIAIPVLSLYGTLFSPESPRWLVSKGRIDEARKILTKFHAGGDADSVLLQFEMAEIENSIAIEQQAKTAASYADMFKSKGNRHRLLISVSIGIFSQWVGNGVVSYYLAIILNSIGMTSVTDQTLINGFLNLWNLIMAICGALLVDRFGRKKLFLTSTLIMLVSYIIITALSATFANTGVKPAGTAVIPFLFIFFGGYAIAFTPLLVSYPAEIWPYALRARGIAVVLSSCYIANLFNVFVNPIALDSIAWKYYFVFVAVLVSALVTIWFTYPETRGHSLEEMAVLFDGDDVDIPSSGEILEKMEQNDAQKRNKNAATHVEVTSKAEGRGNGNSS